MSVEVPTRAEHEALAGRVAALEARLPAPQPAPTPTPQPAPSGFWLSGGNPNNNTQTSAEEFGRWRGRKCAVALAYPPRDKAWDPLVSATSLPQGVWTDKAVKLVVQMPFFPKGGYTYAEAVAGKYDGEWKKFATNWRDREARGFVRPVFSPGWEANHNGASMHYWCGPGGGPQRYTSYREYVYTFRRFVSVVREIYPEAEFCWTMNGHDSPGFTVGEFPANDPRNIYPGRSYVNYIGVDYYDQWPPSFGGTSTSSRRKDFHVEAREVNGVIWYRDFAVAEGLQFAVPEWAVVSGDVPGGNHGGDNPSYVANMHGVFVDTRSIVLPDGRSAMGLEVYYEDEAQGMSLTGRTRNPNAAAEYQSRWRLPS